MFDFRFCFAVLLVLLDNTKTSEDNIFAKKKYKNCIPYEILCIVEYDVGL